MQPHERVGFQAAEGFLSPQGFLGPGGRVIHGVTQGGSFMMLILHQQLKVQNGGQEVVAGPQRKLVFHLGDFEHEQEMARDRDSHLGKSKPKATCPLAQILVGCRRIKQEFSV